MNIIYSKEPDIVDTFSIPCTEMMFVQDMPIRMPGSSGFLIPDHLEGFYRLALACWRDSGYRDDVYFYLTAKRLFTGPTCQWNRPGWHIDGYGTDDINYLWSDSYPTEFCVNQEFLLSEDHLLSMQQMTEQALPTHIKTYPVNSVLKVDNTIVHRVAEPKEEGFRTFAKISVSKNKYNRVGNAHNHLFDYDWDMVERSVQRNDPAHLNNKENV